MKIDLVSTGDPTLDDYPDPNYGGSGPTWRLAREFAVMGHNVTIFAASYEDNSEESHNNVKIRNVKIPSIPIDPIISGLLVPWWYSYKVSNIMAEKQQDIALLRERISSLFPAKSEIPTIYTVSSPDACDFYYEYAVENNNLNKLLFRYKKKIEEYVINESDYVVVLNEFFEEYFKTKNFSNIHTIPLGISKGELSDTEPISEKEGILYVGRFDYNKRPNWLIDMLIEYDFQGLDPTIHLIGSGPMEPELRQDVRDHGLSGQVQFYGRLDRAEVLRHMRNSKLFVLPSAFESASNVVIEAMASKCPVVASNSMGPKSLIDHRKTGLLFDRNNKESLYSNVSEILHRDKLRRQIQQQAYSYVTQNHLISDIAVQYLEITRLNG